MASFNLVDTPEDIYRAVLEFNKEHIFKRELTGNSSKYYIHCIINGKHQFGLSKFCAFKDITAGTYIGGLRYRINGGPAQLRLKKVTGTSWTKYDDSLASIRSEFERWIHAFFPNYTLKNASFITIKNINRPKQKINKITSPDELEVVLQHKKLIGYIGELIAYKYECDRLLGLGAKDPTQYIKHVALNDVNAGFDIFSEYNGEVRLIEVKSNMKGIGDIYITQNEKYNFEKNKNAVIYLVSINNLNDRIGQVTKEIYDLDELGTLEPVLFKVIR